MEREDKIGPGKVAATSRKHKNEDPLPFLKNPSVYLGVGLQFSHQERGQLQVAFQWMRSLKFQQEK